MRATLHKLLAGASLVVLTVFGLTTLSSSDSTDTTQVWGFLNKTCNSEIAVLLDSIDDMLKLRGQEREGIIMDFESYYRVAELHLAEPECHLVADLFAEPPVRSFGTPPPVIWIPVETQPTPRPGQPGGGSGPVVKNPAPPKFTFTTEDLEDLNECVDQKVESILASKKKDRKTRSRKANLSDYVQGADSKYTWISQTGKQHGGYGKTVWKDLEAYVFPDRIAGHKFVDHKHLAAQTRLQEFYHIIQGNRKQADDSSWEGPKPYELFDMEVEAHSASVRWFSAIFRFGAPIADFLESEKKKPKEFKANKEKYQDLEKALADGTITEEQRIEMGKLKKWFEDKANLPNTKTVGGTYDKNADLGCD